MIDGIGGARTWCGWGVLSHNAIKNAVLIDERETKNTHTGSAAPTATGPPGRRPPPKTRAA
jgi:hypothetical protein